MRSNVINVGDRIRVGSGNVVTVASIERHADGIVAVETENTVLGTNAADDSAVGGHAGRVGTIPTWRDTDALVDPKKLEEKKK